MYFLPIAITAFVTTTTSSSRVAVALLTTTTTTTTAATTTRSSHRHFRDYRSSILFLYSLFALQPNHLPRSFTGVAATTATSSSCEEDDTIVGAAVNSCDVASSPSSKSTKEQMNAIIVPDPKYPGTAVHRLHAVHQRVAIIASDGTLNESWQNVRRRLLWAGGLKDLSHATPGQGYTGHSFNDYNHVDLTTMNDESSDNLNDGSVKGISIGNRLGPGIRIASLPELGPGGSWSTCAIGCHTDPPQDVAHVQFRSRVAFKLVWVPNANYDTFVLVDDEGRLLAKGKPSDGPAALPPRRERERNYQIMRGSKYATVAEALATADMHPKTQ